MISAIERFSKNAENRGTGGKSFFKLEEGQRAVLRFLSPMVDNYVVNHASAGCSCHIELPKSDWDKTKEQTGQNPLCPVCQKPFADADIIGVKEGVTGGGFHYIQGSGYLLCLDDPINEQPYACPLCQTMVEKTKRDGTKYMAQNVPQDRAVGYAVVRKVNRSTGTDSRGMPVEQVTGIEDELVEKNGALVPNVVIDDQAYSNFWSFLMRKDDDFRDPITYYDWEIQRVDRTTYTITKVSAQGEIVDIERYRPYMATTLAEHVASKGTPQYYTSKGIHVPGFQQEGGAQPVPGYAQSTLAAAAQPVQPAQAAPAPQAYGQPYAPQYGQPAQAYPAQAAPAQVPMQPQQPVQPVQPTQAAPQPYGQPAQAPVQQAAPAAAPAQQFAPPAQPAGAFMPQPVGAAPAQPVQAAPVQPAAAPAQPLPQQPAQAAPAPQGAPAATVPWADVSGTVGTSVYDEDIPF